MVRENVSFEKHGQEIVVTHEKSLSKSTKTTIPFVKNNNLDYSEVMSFCGKYKDAAGWILFVVITILVVTAVSNGANLNDGHRNTQKQDANEAHGEHQLNNGKSSFIHVVHRASQSFQVSYLPSRSYLSQIP